MLLKDRHIYVSKEVHVSKIDHGFEFIHNIIKHRWVPEILDSIFRGHSSYSRILEDNEYLSKAELNRKLAMLVENDVIIKKLTAQKSEYQLSELGFELDHIFKHFHDIGNKYVNTAV